MTHNKPDCPAPIVRVVPYLHVADVERSVAFYAKLGFCADGYYRSDDGRALWASVKHESPRGAAEVFFAQASVAVIPEDQAILLYAFASDVRHLREHLLTSGLHDGGKYSGQCGPNNGRCVVFEVQFPDYMKDGELRVADPDGYCILIGQYG